MVTAIQISEIDTCVYKRLFQNCAVSKKPLHHFLFTIFKNILYGSLLETGYRCLFRNWISLPFLETGNLIKGKDTAHTTSTFFFFSFFILLQHQGSSSSFCINIKVFFILLQHQGLLHCASTSRSSSFCFNIKMVPSRRSLELIPNEKSRKLTFRRRAMGLRKKTQELTTLCGIDACLIIYEEGKSNDAVLWPPNPEEVKSIIKSCRECNKKINVSSSKLGNQAAQATYSSWDRRLNNFSLDQLIGLVQRLEDLEFKIELEMLEKIFLEEPEVEMPTPPNDQNGVSLLPQPYSDPSLAAMEGTIFSGLEEPEVEMPTFVPASDIEYGVSLLPQLYSDPSLAAMEGRIFSTGLEPPAAWYCLQPMMQPNVHNDLFLM